MKFDAFEQRARALWDEIPESYREGVDGLLVERGARSHPELDEVYTLGECLTESYPSEFGGPDTTRSFVVLHYGSFWRLARAEPDFDWEGELWETLTHELQHHLESLASEDALEGVDYAADENFRRRQGEPFEPLFYRSGEALGDGWYRIEDEYFLEREPGPGPVAFEWRGATYRIAAPAMSADVVFIEVAGVHDPPGALTVVLVRPQRLAERLRRLVRNVRLESAEQVADAVRVGEGEADDE